MFKFRDRPMFKAKTRICPASEQRRGPSNEAVYGKAPWEHPGSPK